MLIELNKPAQTELRRLFKFYFEQAKQNAQHLEKDVHGEALHDLRTASRRMLTWLNVAKKDIMQDVSQEIIKSHKKLVSLTNSSRDLEVRIEILEKSISNYPKLHNLSRILDLWKDEFKQQKSEALEPVRAQINQLDIFWKRFDAFADEQSLLVFDAWFTNALLKVANKLDDSFCKLKKASQKKRLHKVRLLIKKLRYLLEPMRELSSQIAGNIEKLKALQDLLGDIRDYAFLLEQLQKEELRPKERETFALLKMLVYTKTQDLFESLRAWQKREGKAAFQSMATKLSASHS